MSGSGGFLIQAHQYIEEQGQNPDDVSLYGQDSNGTVWAISMMNMLLHNILNFDIENGDTLEAKLSEKESELAEAVEAVEYEPEEDEKVTAKVVKEQLVMIVKDLQASYGVQAP